MRRIRVFWAVVSVLLLALPVVAQDPTKVDPKHYKVEFENDQVRVVRITYGPREKSVMHYHPDGVAVFLTDQHVKFTFPDGKTEEVHAKAGEIRWGKWRKHLPENLSDEPLELMLVEVKTGEAWKHISGTAQCGKPDPQHLIEVGDRPSHSFMVGRAECTWLTPWEIEGIENKEGVATWVEVVSGDSSRGHGFYLDTMANGDQAHYRYKTTSTLEDGVPQRAESKWKLVEGTGKLKGIKGRGTCKGKAAPDGGMTWECEGKYKLP